MAWGKSGVIRKRVLAAVEGRIEDGQVEYDRECEQIDADVNDSVQRIYENAHRNKEGLGNRIVNRILRAVDSANTTASASPRGFTLIELIVVVAIIGILVSVVLASIDTARNRSDEVAAECSEFASTPLRKANEVPELCIEHFQNPPEAEEEDK